MNSYKLPRIAELTHQLRLSPARLRLQQLLAADHLLTLIEPDQYYPYSWVVWRITGYRPNTSEPDPADLRGAALRQDILQLCQDLSRQNPIPESALPWPSWPIKDLAERLNVSPKTISRWRQEGLPAWWTVRNDGQLRLAVPEPGLRRFVVAHRQTVLRCRRFSQMTDTEREQIIERAQQLQAADAGRLHQVCQIIAAETGRSVETIRYTLLRHEPMLAQAIAAGGRKSDGDEHKIIFHCWQNGDTVEALARRFEKTGRTIRKIILCQRRRRILARKIDYIYSPEFDLPDAESRILAEPDFFERPVRARPIDPPADQAHVVYSVNPGAADPLPAEQEQRTFRRYNYCKFRLSGLQQELRRKVSPALLEQAELWCKRVEDLRAVLVESNMKLVTSIARRHMRFGAGLEEMASEGNMILIRAIDKFDYTRGFKFSTYASWAIMKHFARLMPLWQASRRRQQTGCEELLKSASTAEEVSAPVEQQMVGGLVHRLLDALPKRERKVIQWHYGLLEDTAPRSLTQIAARLGVSKERVRQIELSGLQKLRAMLAERKFQYA